MLKIFLVKSALDRAKTQLQGFVTGNGILNIIMHLDRE